MKSDLLKEISDRGFIHQCTDLSGLDEYLANPSSRGYIGFDCTADSLHVGSLVQIMLLRMLKKFDRKPMVLIGDATTMIGDPSGKDESRKILDPDTISANGAAINALLCRILADDHISTRNSRWFNNLPYVNILRDVGPHFSINRMLGFDSVKNRLAREQSLSFLEFNYMILQAYDFRELYKSEDVRLQMGGSDQWGNIVSGIELIRRTIGGEAFGLTTPLIETSSGKKMGKTEDGAVWLSPNKTSIFDYWQFWRNAEDADVGRFLLLFTDLPLSEIARLKALRGSEINDAKIILATEATTIVHGRKNALKAADAAYSIFQNKVVSGDLPIQTLPKLEEGYGLVDVLLFCKLVSSKSEGKRLIQNRGVKIDGETIVDQDYRIAKDELIVSVGKKHHVKIRLQYG